MPARHEIPRWDDPLTITDLQARVLECPQLWKSSRRVASGPGTNEAIGARQAGILARG